MTTRERAARRLAEGVEAEAEAQQRVTNLWLDAWRRLVRNKAAVLGGIIIILLVLIALFAQRIAPYGYAEGDSDDNYMTPLWLTKVLPGHVEKYATIGDKFIVGADYLGRDLLSRIIYGVRVSLPVGLIGALTALMIGLI